MDWVGLRAKTLYLDNIDAEGGDILLLVGVVIEIFELPVLC